ncbi:MAG: zinc-ribbon domain-containing protein [Clostridia bacterium]|nr:zinc-ribbon domain-containing protein [Clostridia bacterium]
MSISEKVAYIKGLAEGLKTDDKLLTAIIDVLGDIAAEIDDVEEVVADMGDQIDAVDEDLASVEELIYDEEDDDCCCCGEDDDECYEVECPACHEVLYLDAEMLEEEGIECPNCGTPLEFDFDGCDDCCCCDCEESSDEEQ